MDLGIAGRVALVTGASKGLGLGIARALAGEGVNVALASRSKERIEAAAAEVGGTGFVHDATDAAAATELVRSVERALGPVDILVCNSGGPPAGADPLGFTLEQWEDAYRSLVLGQIALVQAVLPGMRERRWGRVLSVSSTSVREPIPVLMLSNAHRPGLVAAFKTLARAHAGENVTFNTLLTGRIATDRILENYGSHEDAEAAAAKDVPAGRLGTTEEYGAVAAFLCSERASYITGTALPIDGGMMRSV